MPTDLRPIIAEMADRADDFLAGSTDRVHARAGITELVNMDHPELAPAERARVTVGVMAVLAAEDFSGPSSSATRLTTTENRRRNELRPRLMISCATPNLTRHPPRSVRSRLGGHVRLPRLPDKARA